MEIYLSNPQVLRELLNKLPTHLKYNWAVHLSGMNNIGMPTLDIFSSWIQHQAKILSIFLQPAKADDRRRQENFSPKELRNSNNRHVLMQVTPKCQICSQNHQTSKCREILERSIDSRWELITKKKLCFSCFGRHQIKSCKRRTKCGINNCTKFHHHVLHKQDSEAQIEGPNSQPSFCSTTPEKVLLRICPVVLSGEKNSIETYALLDDGSTVSLIEDNLAEYLGLNGKEDPLNICWTNSTSHKDQNSRRVKLKIRGLYENEEYEIDDVRTMTGFSLPSQNFDFSKMKNEWSHLSICPQNLFFKNDVRPTILLGQDNYHLIMPRKIYEGPPNSPILSWTKLGWIVHGKFRCKKDILDNSNFNFFCYQESEDDLHRLVKDSFKLDNYGITKPNYETSLSPKEEKALKILEETTASTGERYESGLLWATENFRFPPSYKNALSRLHGIERKLDRDPILAEEYCRKIDEYSNKNYVKKLSVEEAAQTHNRTYYLPHFGVRNPNKPGKLRLVFDAAAKSHGVSLNDALLTGPDLLNSLPAVLMKFRQHAIAFVGDIKEMFHQINIKTEDVDSQRFLWRGMERHRKPDTYIMKAMTFGATCSPSTALHVVKLNSRRFEDQYPEASKAICTKEYMDDHLDCCETIDSAINRIQQVIEIHKAGGFVICNWISNSKEVLDNIPEDLKAHSDKQLNSDDGLATERILGMWWDAKTDTFIFRVNESKFENIHLKSPTKREILRVVMSIFDPLGLVSPILVAGRIFLQNIWRSNITCDERLPRDLQAKWEIWLNLLNNVKTFKISRCYLPLSSSYGSTELHIFVDASEEAYSAAVYLRNENGPIISVSLIISKNRVAPLKGVKGVSIPRLELQAAVLGSRLAETVQNSLEVEIKGRMFWSDSQSVLHWIKSDSKKYKQFVANRITEIHDLTRPEEWKWISTDLNPADLATRFCKKKFLTLNSLWLEGPPFLKNCKSEWPDQPPIFLNHKSDLELKKEYVTVHMEKENSIWIIPNSYINRFSSWLKYLRCTAWIIRFTRNLKSHKKIRNTLNRSLDVPELTLEEIEEAEKMTLIAIQFTLFPEEVKHLQSKKALKKSSKLFPLSPFLDEDGIIKMRSRLEASSEIDGMTKFPVILDDCKAVRLLVQHVHKRFLHQGTESVIMELRKKFWIFKIKSIVKKVKNTCLWCKRRDSKPEVPEMGPLPQCRVKRQFSEKFVSCQI
ncbi:uncharacterized protein LOC123307065 [Coccinella septempunctata]|uniref:uncharacterized protein LOC123307065 n=1 Tax=Coccinella septempunctata TaxID=41139 RepID=UPI001D064073|nr:uncharacterized protein LOC123307065 [Coccinella septempunctata]